jgi:hypothetical protein
MTDELYQNLMAQKTRQLCLTLILQNAPQGNALDVLSNIRGLGIEQKPRQPPTPLPLPMIKNDADGADFPVEGLPNLEPFGELPRLRFDQQPELSIEPDPYHEHLKFDI